METPKFANPDGSAEANELGSTRLEDPFVTSKKLSGKGNLFSTYHGNRSSSSSPPAGVLMQSLVPDDEKNALAEYTNEAANGQDEGYDTECEEYGYGEYASDYEDADADTESIGDAEDTDDTDNGENTDADGSGKKKGKKATIVAPVAFRDENGLPIGPDHPSVPIAMNTMQKYMTKVTEHGKDPNGRFEGRNLVMWHRPRMMDKLLLHIQYECHIANFKLPWDKIAHRLNPGSSGPAIVQFLNKQRDVLIAEGHMIPPNMGKSKAVYDQTIRGYVRDMTQEIPTVVRALAWNEKYEDKKESLTVPGMVLGSGKYERNKESRRPVPKETGRRNRVPETTKAVMDDIRVKRGPRPPRNRSRAIKGIINTPKIKVKTEAGNDDEVDPAKLKSDDEYEPGIKSSKRKAKASSTGRKKARVDAAQEADTDFTPSKSATMSVGARAMGKLKIGTPSGTPSKSTPSNAYAAKPEDELNVESAAVSEAEYDLDYGNFEMQMDGVLHNTEGRDMRGVFGPITPPFGASPIDIQTQVQNGLTPSYMQHVPQFSVGSSQNPHGNNFAQPGGGNQYHPPAGMTTYAPFEPYSSNAYGDIYQDNNPYNQPTFNAYGGGPNFDAYGGYSSSFMYDYPSFGTRGSVFNDLDDLNDFAVSSQPGFSNQYDDPRLDQENIMQQGSGDL